MKMMLKVVFIDVRLLLESFAVIVCHCQAVSDRAIRACALKGACSLEEVGDATGAGTCCGGCHSVIEEIVRECAAEGPSEIAVRRLPLVVEPSRAA
ncbi:MAG TPA: (2Fe-2S)-binding protein [Polyangiaceae bacterium]